MTTSRDQLSLNNVGKDFYIKVYSPSARGSGTLAFYKGKHETRGSGFLGDIFRNVVVPVFRSKVFVHLAYNNTYI